MKNIDFEKLKKIIRLFSQDKILDIKPLGQGHINSTFRVILESDTSKITQLVLQKINNYVFRDVKGLMGNICGVTQYLKQRLKAGETAERNVMTVVNSLSGEPFEVVDGDYYRCYLFIDDTVTYQNIEKPQDFYNCGAAFADFQERLSDYPAYTLCETIVNFHNTESRYNDFVQSVHKDAVGRKSEVGPEIDFCLSHKDIALEIVNRLKKGTIPLRVTHNDSKLNNILFDGTSGKPLCIVDLDTIMPGAACYDFADAIRFGASSAAEDEKDLDKVYLDLSLFEAYTAGYLSRAKYFLTNEEIETLPVGAMVITFENAMRFLADYLDGDVYYTIHYPQHNLDRCRTQIKLVQDMLAKMPQMKEIVFKHAK